MTTRGLSSIQPNLDSFSQMFLGHWPHWYCALGHFFLSSRMRLKVRLIRGREILLRTGRLWYQKVLVGEFMRSRLPWASSSFTGSICRRLRFPRASRWRKIKSRAAPRETEAMGQRGSSSFSSSRCSPMWSWPSLYLAERGKKKLSAGRQISNWPLQLVFSNFSPVDQNKVKCLSSCFRDSITDIFQGWSPRAGQTCHPGITVG